MNEEQAANYPIKKEGKIMLLKAMQRGYFTDKDKAALLGIVKAMGIDVRICNNREDVEFYDEYDKWCKEQGK